MYIEKILFEKLIFEKIFEKLSNTLTGNKTNGP